MLLISTELEEILDLADRIVVIVNGRIVGEMPNVDVDVERLGLLMTGADDESVTQCADDVGERARDHSTSERRRRRPRSPTTPQRSQVRTRRTPR